MLSKNKIDKKLRKYIKEHLSKGYSKHAVKKVLVDYGYNEPYIDELLRKHSEVQFVKRYAIIVSLLFIFSFFSLNLISTKEQQKITGLTISSKDEGCCIAVCQQTSKNECYGKFVVNEECDELEDCNVGCCIDKEGYCLTNYLHNNCINSDGAFINKDCSDIVFCRNITDKSYTSRLHNIKDKKGAGIFILKPIADYYKSSFNIGYYLYDKTNILSVGVEIKDNNELVDSVALYDDGSHNDEAKNDNLYANNWLSSKIRYFEGFKKLDINIIVKYADGTQQSINQTQNMVVLSNNKCLPIYTEWSSPNEKYSIIFASDNYEPLSNGYQKFQTDVQNFLSIFFSIDKFLNNQNKFNIYRLEQSLSYFNIPTLTSIVSSSCPSYSNKKDLIVVLDNNEDYCLSESLRVVRTNPQVLFYKNITNFEINQTFADFCSYVLTQKKLADEIVIFVALPKIIVYTLDNITYNTSIVNLSFSISASNYPVNYFISLNDTVIANKIFNSEIYDIVVLNLTNGTNDVLIEVNDKNDNTAFAELLLNATIK